MAIELRSNRVERLTFAKGTVPSTMSMVLVKQCVKSARQWQLRRYSRSSSGLRGGGPYKCWYLGAADGRGQEVTAQTAPSRAMTAATKGSISEKDTDLLYIQFLEWQRRTKARQAP
jgi:hypothetical protein